MSGIGDHMARWMRHAQPVRPKVWVTDFMAADYEPPTRLSAEVRCSECGTLLSDRERVRECPVCGPEDAA